MQEKHEQPESGETKFSPLGEYGAIPGAPNGPPDPFMMLGVPAPAYGPRASSPATPMIGEDSDERAGRPRPIAFFPIRDLPKLSSEDANWIWDGYLARGAVTLLVSEPKAGKSTLAFGLMQKLLAGEPFLGRMCGTCGTGRSVSARESVGVDSHQPESSNAETGATSASNDPGDKQAARDDDTGSNGPARATLAEPPIQNPKSKIQNPGVLYFSEEPLSTLREKAERFELPVHGERIQLVSRRQSANRKIDLQTALDKAVEKAHAIGAGLIVIDTLSAWSGLKAEQENSAAPCEALMSKFTDAATRSNTAMLLIHHTRKDGASARGSTVLTGSADIVLKLKRDMSGSSNTSSTLRVDSRFCNSPEPLSFELTDDGYKTIGTENAARKHAQVYGLLPKEPPGLTCDEICNKTGFGRWKVRCALNDLVAHSLVIANGIGIRSEPLRFQRCA